MEIQNGKDVPAVITIADFDTISMALDAINTNDHFNGQLIDGVVQSVKTSEDRELLLIVMEPANSDTGSSTK